MSPASSASWVPISANQRTPEPYSFTWSIVCPAPDAASSGGRSLVRTISGTDASLASATAGWRFAAAVPDVHAIATGLRDASAAPRAKKPPERSSTTLVVEIPGSRRSASATGVEREPGQITACSTPERASSSTRADASAVLRLVGSIGENAIPLTTSRRLPGPSSSSSTPRPGPVGQVELAVAELALAGGDALGEQALGCQAVRDARVGAVLAHQPARRGRQRRSQPARPGRSRGRWGGCARSAAPRPRHPPSRASPSRIAARAPLDRAMRVRLGRDGLVGGQGNRRLARDAGHRPQPAHRLLGELDPEGLDQVEHVGGQASVPRLVRVNADLHIGAHGLADGFDGADVVGARAELQLHRAESPPAPSPPPPRRPHRARPPQESRCR